MSDVRCVSYFAITESGTMAPLVAGVGAVAAVALPVAAVLTVDVAAGAIEAAPPEAGVPSVGLIPVNVPDNNGLAEVVPEELVVRFPPEVGNTEAVAPVDAVKEAAGDAAPVAENAAAAVVEAVPDVPSAGTVAAAPVTLLAFT